VSDLNTVTLSGTIAAEPRDLGGKGTGLRLKSTKVITKRDGTQAVIGMFISAVFWGSAANSVVGMQEGHRVLVTGRLGSSSYENQSGQKVYEIQIEADSATLLPSTPGLMPNAAPPETAAPAPAPQAQMPVAPGFPAAVPGAPGTPMPAAPAPAAMPLPPAAPAAQPVRPEGCTCTTTAFDDTTCPVHGIPF
jgi:single-stranded DNA-binding protein